MTINIALSTTSLVVSLIAIMLFVTMMLCICKKGSLKSTLSRMKGFSINPSCTFHKLRLHTFPIYNPNSSEDEDDTDAL